MMKADSDLIAVLLSDYQQALNQSDVEAVMKLYAADGVFMPQNSPSRVGVDEVRKAYQAVFSAIRLSVDFAIVEVVPVANDWAFARTNSAGTVKVNATGMSAAEANQELFILQKLDGSWKIARYCFSTTNPPKG